MPTDPSIILLHIECAVSYRCHNTMLLTCFFVPSTNCLDKDCWLSYCCHKAAEAWVISCAPNAPFHYPVSRQTTFCHRSVILERLIALPLRDRMLFRLQTITLMKRIHLSLAFYRSFSNASDKRYSRFEQRSSGRFIQLTPLLTTLEKEYILS